MPYSKEDRILIMELRAAKGYGARRLLKEFPAKPWSLPHYQGCLKTLPSLGRQTGSQAAVHSDPSAFFRCNSLLGKWKTRPPSLNNVYFRNQTSELHKILDSCCKLVDVKVYEIQRRFNLTDPRSLVLLRILSDSLAKAAPTLTLPRSIKGGDN